MFQNSATQSVAHGPVASTSFRSLLESESQAPHRPTKLESTL